MVNPTIKQLCICQICICGEHKCNPDNPYEICSIRGANNKISTGVGDYVITNNDMISETERAARREKCRKQWQISPEALKSISNSYPKVSDPSASSAAASRGEGRIGGGAGGHNRRHHQTSNVKQSSSSLNHNRKLPPIERTIESQNFDSSNVSISRTESHQQQQQQHQRSISSNAITIDKSVEATSYTREGTESSCSRIMESQHRETTLDRVDASVKEDHSISCEPEWIVSRPTKVKPTDNLKWEGPMELETTFKSTIDSTAAQRLIASRQGEGESSSSASPMNPRSNNEGDPSVPFKRRHRPKTSLKPGGEGYYSTINKESYKNFVVVDQSREQLVQDRLDALARSMDEKAAAGDMVNGHLKRMDHQDHNRSQSKSRLKKSSDIQPTPSRSSASDNQQPNNQHRKVAQSKPKVLIESKSHQSEAHKQTNQYENGVTMTSQSKQTQSSKEVASSVSVEKKLNSTSTKEVTRSSEESMKSNEKQKKMKEGEEQSHHVKMTTINESKAREKVDKGDKVESRKSELNGQNESGRGSHNKSPIPTKSGGTVPFADPIVRPSPIRPTSSLTLNCKFKGDETSSTESEEAGKKESTSSYGKEANQVIIESVSRKRESGQKDGKDAYTVYEESLKSDRERVKGSKSNPSLANGNGDHKQQTHIEKEKREENRRRKKDSDEKRSRSLPRHRGSRNRNESHLRFVGPMEFETTSQHYFQDGLQINEYIRETRSYDHHKPHRDLFRTSSEAELNMKTETELESKRLNKKNSKSTTTMTTTYNSVFRNKLYCPVIDLTPKNPEFQYKGEAGGHHFFQPVYLTTT